MNIFFILQQLTDIWEYEFWKWTEYISIDEKIRNILFSIQYLSFPKDCWYLFLPKPTWLVVLLQLRMHYKYFRLHWLVFAFFPNWVSIVGHCSVRKLHLSLFAFLCLVLDWIILYCVYLYWSRMLFQVPNWRMSNGQSVLYCIPNLVWK